MTRALRLATVLALLIPAAHAAVIRLIQRNGDSAIARDIVSLRINRGVVEYVPDTIFATRFER